MPHFLPNKYPTWYSVEDVILGNDQGQTVRWEGKLIETQPKAHETCFTVLGESLRRDGRPEPEGERRISVASSPGFYGPMLYCSGREITFIGRVEGIAHRKIGTIQS